MIVNASSFRDPSGFIFSHMNSIYRCVNTLYKDQYNHLMTSGLYHELVQKQYLVPHEEIVDFKPEISNSYKILRPQQINFISYANEWCFEQLKDAALLTLEIQLIALKYGMYMKDANTSNIQFDGSHPILIDTLSFEFIGNKKYWPAYNQFCVNFLNPLLLIAYRSHLYSKFLASNISGIPLDFVSKTLPLKTFFDLGILLHVHIHSYMSKKYQNSSPPIPKLLIINSNKILENITTSLYNLIDKLKFQHDITEWNNYYNSTNYSKNSDETKIRIFNTLIDNIKPKTLLDIGSNTGKYCHLISDQVDLIYSTDSDFSSISKNYKLVKKKNLKNILPLVIDVMNPSSSSGWYNEERESFWSRVKCDCIVMLAIVHHLVITNNVPFDKIAKILSVHCSDLIIEFIDDCDSQISIINRSGLILSDYYSIDLFEYNFQKYFNLVSKNLIDGTFRYIYHFKSINNA
jgi:hypothetical protein